MATDGVAPPDEDQTGVASLEELKAKARDIRERVLADPSGRASYDKATAQIKANQAKNRT